MEENSKTQFIGQLSLYGPISIIIGIGLMVFMGILLYEGMEIVFPQDTESNRNLYLVIICQSVESLAWMMAFSATLLPRVLRYGMLSVGVLAFAFSILLMTAAQKTMNLKVDLVNNNVKQEIDIVQKQLNINVETQEVVVNTAKNNSKSVHTLNRDKAREVGKDLAEEKNELEENRKDLNALNKQLTITSQDIFIWGEELTGMAARDLEFMWLIFRSFFFECCAILFLAAGSVLLPRRQSLEHDIPRVVVDTTAMESERHDTVKKPVFKVLSIHTKAPTTRESRHRIPDDQLFAMVNQLFKDKAIKLNRTSIQYGLKHHHGIGIGSGRAGRILEYLLSENNGAQIILEAKR